VDDSIEEVNIPWSERCRTMIEPNNFKRYAGIGTRKVKENEMVYHIIQKISSYLHLKGYTLLSGAAEGADSAFESQAEYRKEIYLPWEGFNNKYSTEVGVFSPAFLSETYSKERNDKATEIARAFHPRFDYLSDGAKKLMIRNSFQILGLTLGTPVDFVVCYTLDGCESATTRTEATGGTGQAISIAHYYNVPIFNVFNISSIHRLKAYIDSQESTFDGNKTIPEIGY
jgi:hypothetical protein